MAHAKPRVTIPINRYVLTDIEACVILSSKLSEILATASSVGPCATLDTLAENVAGALSIDPEAVERVFRVIVNFSAIIGKSEIDAQAILDNLTVRIRDEAPTPWKKKHLEGWEQLIQTIVDILTSMTPSHPILITYKAETLAYTQPSLLIDAKIITDVRPIFNEEADDVIEFVVSHSLILRYLDGKTETKSHISIDAADIRKIRTLCDRAEEKSNTLLSVFSNFGKKIAIVGKEDD